MAVIQMSAFSQALNMFSPISIILPQPRSAHTPPEKLPTLYLLHGLGDDASAWLRKTCVERYALEYNIAIVMPEGGISCYENMAHGGAYQTYLCSELPALIRRTFPVSGDRAQNFIAGCSMGGFGALKAAMAHPDIWSRIGCFSAAHFEYRPESPRVQNILRLAYGDHLDESDAQIVSNIHAANSGRESLSLWHCCGDADILRENALKTRAFFESLKPGAIEYRFEQLPGQHDWALWDDAVRRFIHTLSLPRSEVQRF